MVRELRKGLDLRTASLSKMWVGLSSRRGWPATFRFAPAVPTTAVPTTAVPTTAVQTTAVETIGVPTTGVPTTAVQTIAVPTTAVPTTAVQTIAVPTTGVIQEWEGSKLGAGIGGALTFSMPGRDGAKNVGDQNAHCLEHRGEGRWLSRGCHQETDGQILLSRCFQTRRLARFRGQRSFLREESR